jgi:integrase
MPLKLKKRGEIWHYTGTVAGRRLRGSTKTTQKAEGERFANEVESRELQGRRDPGSVLTFAQAAMEYRKAGKAPKYLELVEDHWRDMPVKDITRGAMKRAAIEMLPNGSGAYRNRAVIVPTQAVINHCAELEMCPPLRARRFPEPVKTKEPATLAWVEDFMAHASPHLGALALFMYATGARISEALNVTWGDIDLQSARVRIVMGKAGGAERRARLQPNLVAALANIEGEREPIAQVFPYAAYDSVRKPWNAVVARAGIKMLTPHCCRHGFATGLMHQGVNPKTVAKMGGWRSTEQLFRTYGHSMDDETVVDLLMVKPQAQTAEQPANILKFKWN